MEKGISIIKRVSPWIAEKFGLKPTFVTILLMILSAMCYFTFDINRNFKSQNEILNEQIKATNAIIKEVNSKVTEHENRLTVIESQLKTMGEENNMDRLKVTEALTRLDAKLDMVTYDVRALSAVQLRRK